MKYIIVTLAVLMALSGCASSPRAQFSTNSQSIAQGKLRADALGLIGLMESFSGCAQIRITSVSLIAPPDPQDMKEGRIRRKDVIEHWTVDSCGKVSIYEVTITPMPDNTAGIGVKMINKK